MTRARAAILTLLAFAPCASASEGLFVLGAYLCNAVAFTETLVKDCSTKYPDIAARTSTALESWRQRNSTAAVRAQNQYIVELRKRSPASVEEELKKLETEGLNAARLGLKDEGEWERFCRELPSDLQNTKFDLEQLSPK